MPRRFVLTFLLCACCLAAAQGRTPSGQRPDQVQQKVKLAQLGAATRAPTPSEVKTLGLPFAVRTQGQIVTEVDPKGPAARAGLERGDAILALNANTLFSRDDVEDFLRVTKPGTKVSARVARARTAKREKLAITLGTRTVGGSPGITWKHAGLAQLKTVLKLARDDRKRILVGLSGAET
ncbi:MAG: hypothetical protein CMJ83_17685 [Planctomycetes bacterium]|nr:hypothetical protein [Planctomycetota bacterium]